MKILHIVNQMSMGGTEKTVICFSGLLRAYFDHNSSIFTFKGGVLAEKAARASDEYVQGDVKDLENLLNHSLPDVIHLHRGGWAEDGAMEVVANYKRHQGCKVVETNIFGDVDRGNFVGTIDLHLFVSEYLKHYYLNASNGKTDISKIDVLYNPVNQNQLALTVPKEECKKKLCEIYGIPDCKILALRMGRAANYYGISVKAFNRLISQGYDIRILSFGTPSEMREALSGSDRFHFSTDYIIDKERLDLVYRGSDVLMHDRIDGETFGIVIAEAMMAQTPVVSHISSKFQGHLEILDGNIDLAIRTLHTQPNLIKIKDSIRELKGGYIVGLEDDVSYAKAILESQINYRNGGYYVAMENYSVSNVILKLEEIYRKLVLS